MKKYCMHCMQPLSESDVECPFCGKALEKEVPPHHLCPGTELKEKYLVGYAIGQGGFGITYVGWDKQLELKVAIKEYFPTGHVNRSSTVSSEVSCNPSDTDAEFFQKGRERFLEEARVLAKFAGEPGIVAVREYFEVNNTAYIVMNYLEGEDLKDYLKSRGVISADETLELMMPVMKTLEKVHRQRLVHRDISPDNMRYTKGNLVLLDFGAARSVAAYSDKSMSVMLKPGYAPHEQYYCKGNQGEWTDVYALCATMYKCITGITPPEAISRYPEDTLKTPEALGFQVDLKIQTALMKGLSLMPEDRFQSVGELIRGLKGFIVETDPDDKPTTDNPGGPKPPSPAPDEPKHPGGDGPTIDPPKPKGPEEPNGPNNPHPNKLWWRIALLVFGILLILGILITLMVEIGKVLSERSEDTLSSLTPTPTVAEVEINNAKPEYLEEYKAPTELGDDILSGIISINGTLYQVPIPVSEFLNNGWTLECAETSIAAEEYNKSGGAFGNLQKGDAKLEVWIKNYADYRTIVENCVVTEIRGLSSKDNIIIELPGGITFNSEREDIDKQLSSEWFIGEYSDQYVGYKYTMELLFEDKRKLSEVTVSGSNLERWGEQENLLPTPSPEPTPTPSPEPTPTETPEPTPTPSPEPTPTETQVPVEEDEYAVGFEVKPYNNGGEEYNFWWEESELNLSIGNISAGVSTGKILMTVYLPTEALDDGMYGIELFIANKATWDFDCMGFGSVAEFSVLDGKIMQRDERLFTKVKTGYICRLETNYVFEELSEVCNIMIKLHSSTSGENGSIYFGNFHVQDEEFGNKYLDVESGNYTTSMIRLFTGEQLEVKYIPGNYLWIYE